MHSENATNRPARQCGSISVSWLLWIGLSIAGSTVFATMMFNQADKSVFMPGPLSSGHHQLVDACDTCHTDEFGGDEVLQNSCIDCHGDERVDGIDSHPISKFEDPRNADRLEQINATYCITCHVEHQPAITLNDGLTQPSDVCFHCHQDVAEDRASHEGMGFETCASSGCHNYHDNRALYTKFLINHADDADLLDSPFVDDRDFADVLLEIMEYPHEAYPVQALDTVAMDAPESLEVPEGITREWLESSHAAAGVNCSACHQTVDETGLPSAWQSDPGLDGCSACHGIEVDQFGKGKHGMRVANGLSAMTPEQALLPMHADVGHEALTCSSCHGAHDYDTQTAAVEACEACHADDHTAAYRQSRHYALWLNETEGDGEPGSGVSCATCHMPREEREVNDWMERVVVNHNQNATLSPSSKMLRPACLSCHGLEYSLDALADDAVINSNFSSGTPVHSVDSVEMARRLQAEHERKRAERQ